MKVIVSTGRVNYEPQFGYRDGVRIGTNWFEETVKYIHEKHDHNSIYRTDFTPKPPNAVHPNLVWNNIIAGEGIDRQILMNHEGDLYLENYSATTDLCYNWLPHCKKHRVYNTRKMTYLPEQDYALNYGNVTNFGLKEEKKRIWKYDNSTGSNSWTTEFRDNFLRNDQEVYKNNKSETKGIPRIISSKMFHINNDYDDYRPRGKRLAVVPDFPLRVQQRKYPHFYF